MKNIYAYHNGKISPLGKVRISPYDLGLLRGYGVFDVMVTANCKPFLLDAHWRRLQNSAKELNLKIPVFGKEYKKIITQLIKKNGFTKSNIRTVLTGGVSSDGFTPQGKETFFILVEKFKPLPQEHLEKGVGIVTHCFQRSIPRAKVTNYVEAIRMIHKKKKSGALEMCYFSDDGVSENSMSNIFIFKGSKLVTAKDGILFGTTRNLVLKLAKGKFVVEERKLSEKELRGATEVFLTGANKDIVPVVRIDGRKVGDGRVGKNTKILMEEFRRFVEKY